MSAAQYRAFVSTVDDETRYTLVAHTPGVELTEYHLVERTVEYHFRPMPGAAERRTPTVSRTIQVGEVEKCVLADARAKAARDGEDVSLYSGAWLEEEYTLAVEDDGWHEILTSDLPGNAPDRFMALVGFYEQDGGPASERLVGLAMQTPGE